MAKGHRAGGVGDLLEPGLPGLDPLFLSAGGQAPGHPPFLGRHAHLGVERAQEHMDSEACLELERGWELQTHPCSVKGHHSGNPCLP